MARRLLIIGRGVTAERIAELAGRLGYDEVGLSDDLPDLRADDHLVIAEEDVNIARDLLHSAAEGTILPAYLGYAAPHKEGWKALVGLAARNVPKARIDAVCAPAGVDVGAETPEEVAISVAAELVALRRGRPLPSAGLDVTATRRPAVDARPRRLIGAFGRAAAPPPPPDALDGDDDDDNGGKN
jgi:xanthine dehydrogenase accessory factor